MIAYSREKIINDLISRTYVPGVGFNDLSSDEKKYITEQLYYVRIAIENNFIMYHGTSSDRLDSITSHGLHNPYITPLKSMAISYAIIRSKSRGSKPVLITLRLDYDLVVDSIAEGFWSPEDIPVRRFISIEFL